MSGKDLYRAFNEVDDDILERSEAVVCECKKKDEKKGGWLKYCAVAACLCLVVIGTIIWKQSAASKPPYNRHAEITVSEHGVTIPQMEVSLSANEAADMIAFFIYQGRCYVQYGWIYDNADIVGEYLGTATGLIDEWTPKEGYVELAGSVSGDFYSVQGYDPSFMLCMTDTEGTVSAYICNNGITLKYGSELYEDRLHLSGNFESVQYESRSSWYFSRGGRYQMDSIHDAVLRFIQDMDDALFLLCDSVPLEEGQTSMADTELYHLYFRMEDGTTVHLRLHENGYVRFQGMLQLCVQVPEESFNKLLELLDSHTDATAVEAADALRNY